MEDDTSRQRAADVLLRNLKHYDPPQLWFQIGEIVRDRCYLRHGIEVNEGDVVFDIGANVGVAAAFFAEVCGAGTIHSFEPAMPIFELLSENVANYPACTPHAFGIAREDGWGDFTFYPRAAAMSGFHADADRDAAQVQRIMENLGLSSGDVSAELEDRFDAEILSCESRRLSRVIAELSINRIDLLKIDVERAELDVLGGLADADWALISQLVVEIHDEKGEADSLSDDLRERGFEVAVDQEDAMRGTAVKVLFAKRPSVLLDAPPTSDGRPAPPGKR